MNFGLTASFISGGILLISLLSLQLNLFRNSTQSTLSLMSMNNVEAITEVIDHDLTKVGYDVTSDVITFADANQITFLSDINNDGTTNTVTWQFDPAQPDTDTPNPNDRQLQRTVDGNTITFPLNVTSFSLEYKTKRGTSTTDPDSICRIHVEIICQAPDRYHGRYAEAVWEKTYIPINFFLQ